MIGHTKLPWHAEDDRVNFGAGLLVAECYGGTTKESIANAAFIVKAVNNHEALVAALTIAEDVLSRAPFSAAIWPNGMHPNTGIEKIRQVLADVGGSRE